MDGFLAKQCRGLIRKCMGCQKMGREELTRFNSGVMGRTNGRCDECVRMMQDVMSTV